VRSVHISRPPRTRKERVEMDRKVLQHMLDYIQNCGEAKGLTITTDEMAGKLGITGLVLEAYLSGGERVPKHLTIRLRDAYDSLLKPIQLKQNREGLKHGVVLLRNHGANPTHQRIWITACTPPGRHSSKMPKESRSSRNLMRS